MNTTRMRFVVINGRQCDTARRFQPRLTSIFNLKRPNTLRETLIIDLFMVLKFVFGMKFVVSSNTKTKRLYGKRTSIILYLNKRAVFATARRSYFFLLYSNSIKTPIKARKTLIKTLVIVLNFVLGI
jgi:hypothetical protein